MGISLPPIYGEHRSWVGTHGLWAESNGMVEKMGISVPESAFFYLFSSSQMINLS